MRERKTQRKEKMSHLLRGSTLFANFYEHFLILASASSSRIDEFIFEEFLGEGEKEGVSFQSKR